MQTSVMRRTLTAVFAVGALVTLAACSSSKASSAGSGSGAGTSSGASSGSSAPLKTTHIKVAITQNTTNTAFFDAVQKGYFTSAGLEVESTVLQSGAQEIPLLLNGELQFGVTDIPSVALANQQGIPLQFVASALYQPATGDSADGIVIRSDGKINSPADLVGKTVAVPSVSSGSAMLLRRAVDKAGGDSSKVKLVEMGQPAMLAAIQAGTVDAGQEVEPFVTQAAQTSGLEVLVRSGTYASPGLMASGYGASKKYADANPAVVSAFSKAIQKANADISTSVTGDGSAARDIISKNTSITADLIKTMVLPTFSPNPIKPADIQPILDSLFSYGILTSKETATTLIWSGN